MSNRSNRSNAKVLKNRSFRADWDDLSDEELVLAIMEGHAEYRELLKRSPDPHIAARFYALIAAQAHETDQTSEQCEMCGLPGEQVILNWRAVFFGGLAQIIGAVLLLPFALAGLLHFGFAPKLPAVGRDVVFVTHHCLCRACKPSHIRQMIAFAMQGMFFVTMLFSLAGLIISGISLVCWLVGILDVESDFYLSMLFAFILSSYFLLALWTGWHRKLIRAVTLPSNLHYIAKGPFELDDNSKSFRLSG